ncbi:hypothetical protein TP41_03795 [Xanthomonas euvesicatoria pv. citrumelonis]|nr:hypothetical protein TP41_03795 [Xanthomonas euvesicatoria pv. citrumelonis]
MIYYAQCNHGVSLQNFEISTKEKPPARHRRLFFEQHFPFESIVWYRLEGIERKAHTRALHVLQFPSARHPLKC